MDEICLSDARQSAGRFFQKMTKPVFAFILLITSLAASPLAAEPVDLTDEERAYIAAHPVATIGLVADNEPYSFYLNGKIMGWSVDVLDAISAMTGLDFAVRLGSWPEIYGQFRQGGIQGLGLDVELRRPDGAEQHQPGGEQRQAGVIH